VKIFEKKDLFRGQFHLGLRSPNLIPKKVSGRFFIAAWSGEAKIPYFIMVFSKNLIKRGVFLHFSENSDEA
jgi:hypothetical protein